MSRDEDSERGQRMSQERQQPLGRQDLNWLLGPEHGRIYRATEGRQRRTVKRTSRWTLAYKALPSPASHGAAPHVLTVWFTAVMPRLEVEGWRDFASRIVRQEQWWYEAACLLLAQSFVEQHVTSCQVCNVDDWNWILAVPHRTPRGVEFDPDGNTKPSPKEGT